MILFLVRPTCAAALFQANNVCVFRCFIFTQHMFSKYVSFCPLFSQHARRAHFRGFGPSPETCLRFPNKLNVPTTPWKVRTSPGFRKKGARRRHWKSGDVAEHGQRA